MKQRAETNQRGGRSFPLGQHPDQDQDQNHNQDQPIEIQLCGDPNLDPRGGSNTHCCCLHSQKERQRAGKLREPQGLKNNKTQHKLGNAEILLVCVCVSRGCRG